MPLKLRNLIVASTLLIACAVGPAAQAAQTQSKAALTTATDKVPVTITGGPSTTLSSASATFTISKTYSASALHCQLDGAAVAACVSPITYSGLSNGSHHFRVYATAGVNGRVVGLTQTRAWTVSVPAPPPVVAPAPPVVAPAPRVVTPPSPITNPNLVWNGDLSTGNTSQYGFVQGCSAGVAPQGVSVVSSPTRPGYAYSSAFTVSDQSTTANCPNLGSAGHPNANIQSPGIFRPGDNDYIGFSTMFPSSFPSNVCTPWVSLCWMQVMEIYGQPYTGVTPIGLYVIGNRLALDETPNPIWTASTDIVKGAWQDVVLHVNFSTDPAVGYVELWYNGVHQTFTNGQTRYYEATLKTGDNWDGTHADKLYLSQYRGPNPAMGTLTIYHSAAKVAQTYAQAAP